MYIVYKQRVLEAIHAENILVMKQHIKTQGIHVENILDMKQSHEYM